METVRVRARITTTHRVDKYGGFQLKLDDLHDIADAIRSGRIPMQYNHDMTRPMPTTNVEAGIERLEDGHFAVWAEFDTDADAWAEYEAQRDAAGAPGGMSFSFTRSIPGQTHARTPQMIVAADAEHFEHADILRAARELGPIGEAEAACLYQFAVGPEAKVIIELAGSALGAVSLNLIASALYDAAKSFLRSRRSTVFNLTVRESRSGRRSLKLHLAADDPDALRVATDRAAEIMKAGAEGIFTYDNTTQKFRPIGLPEPAPDAETQAPQQTDR